MTRKRDRLLFWGANLSVAIKRLARPLYFYGIVVGDFGFGFIRRGKSLARKGDE